MIFLIAKIFVYMLLALGLGAAAGWLWRHQQATAREAELEKALLDARSRLPQMETALRAREERVEVVSRELAARDEAIAAHEEHVAARDRTVAELERACADLRQRLAELQAAEAPGTTEDAVGDELALHPGDPHDGEAAVPAEPASVVADAHAGATEAVDSEPASPVEGDDGATPPTVTGAEVEALEAELEETRAALASAQTALAGEQRRVTELTRERELQHHALRALEQQLELAEERRAANG